MRRQTRSLLGAAVSLICLASCAGAATVSGAVSGPDDAVFRGAFVSARNQATKVTTYVLSDRSGRYRVPDLPAGDYEVRVKATGYESKDVKRFALAADQNASADMKLAKAPVRWSDLSMYQGLVLLPDGPGKKPLFNVCFACHGFESRMAAKPHDRDGWSALVNYMVDSMHFFLAGRITDKEQADVTNYLAATFGPDSKLPPPDSLPKYNDVKLSFDDEALRIVYVEYEVPNINSMPWSGAPDKDGKIWVPYYGDANKIARLDPATAAIEEFDVPFKGTAAIHSAVPANDGSVWLTEQGSNRLGRWDPSTKKISEFADAYTPGKEGTLSGGSKHTLRIASNGDVWSTGGPLTRFDPRTGKFTAIPEVPSVYGIALGQDDTVWFAEYTPNGGIGKVDPKTLEVTKYIPPTRGSRARRIQLDKDGVVWFAEFQSGKIGSFDPKTRSFEEFALPGAEPTPYALALDDDHQIWFSSEHMDYIGRLDPKTGRVLQYPIPHAENSMREFFHGENGRMWYGTPANDKVGYFYIAK